MKKSELPKFIVCRDYSNSMKFDFTMMKSKELLEAIKEATEFVTDDVYLVKIFQRTNDNHYEAILTNRRYGWKDNESGHESEFVIAFVDYKFYESRFSLNSYIDIVR